jgi:hypothetical protein
MLASIALPNQRCRHGLFHNMSECDLVVLVRLLASQRYMRLLLAKSAACLAAFRVLAAELFIDSNRRTFHLKVAEWAFRQEVKASTGQVFLLLQMFQSIERLVAQNLLEIFACKRAITVVNSKTLWATIRDAHLRLDLPLRTLQAIGMSRVAITGDHTVEWYVGEAACALAHSAMGFRVCAVVSFGLLLLLSLASLRHFALDLLLHSVKFLWHLAPSFDQYILHASQVARSANLGEILFGDGLVVSSLLFEYEIAPEQSVVLPYHVGNVASRYRQKFVFEKLGTRKGMIVSGCVRRERRTVA